MTEQDTNDWKPRQGWASNFRKYRWFNLVLPVLTPMGLIAIFLFGFAALGVTALVVSAFSWFDLARSAKSSARRTAWQVFSLALVPLGLYLILLQFIPALQG